MGQLRRRGWVWGLLLLIGLAPGAWLAWQFADVPQLGTLHDDGLYVAGARSLAEQGEHRLASFPEQPWQTKYPPLFPALLAIAWKAGGVTVGLQSGTWALALVTWLGLPLAGIVSWRWYLQAGFAPPLASVLGTLFLITPLVVFMAQHALADLFFTALVVASVMMAERGKPGWAGLLGGLAYLTRTAALPLLVTSPLLYWMTGRRRSAAAFGGTMLAFVAGWAAWVSTHRQPAPDAVRMYYFDYLGFYFANVTLAEFPALVWANLWFWITGAGTLLLNAYPDGMLRTLLVVAAVACLSGLRRLYAENGAWRNAHYLWFGAGFVALLVCWNFPPNERFSVPVYPLLLAGLATEARHVWVTFLTGWRNTRGANRVVAAVGLAVLALLPPAWLWFNGPELFRGLPAVLEAKRRGAGQREAAYAWIREHAEPAAKFYAYDDPILYLRTGRTGMAFHAPTRFGYRDDTAAVAAELLSLPGKARQHGLDYVLLTDDDFHRENAGEERARIIAKLKGTPGWSRVFEAKGAAVFRIEGSLARLQNQQP